MKSGPFRARHGSARKPQAHIIPDMTTLRRWLSDRLSELIELLRLIQRRIDRTLPRERR